MIGVKAGKSLLKEWAMEHLAEEGETPIIITEAIAVSQIKDLAPHFDGTGFIVHDDTALLRQVVLAPDVMIANEKMHLHSSVRQLGQFAQETDMALRHDLTELKPIVEHVAQKIDGSGFCLDAIKEIHEPPLARAARRKRSATKVRIGKEVYHGNQCR